MIQAGALALLNNKNRQKWFKILYLFLISNVIHYSVNYSFYCLHKDNVPLRKHHFNYEVLGIADSIYFIFFN